MKIKSIFLFTIAAYSMFLISCGGSSNSSASGNLSSNNEVEKSSSENKNENVQEVIVEEFQLASISGIFAPHGGEYEFDASKGKWCERPMAADMMAMGGDSPKSAEELTTYFDNTTTKRFNSIQISMKSTQDSTYVIVNYKGSSIFENAFKKQSGKKEIKANSLRKLDLNSDGSMLLTDGKDFIISIEDKPSISFTNDIGSYTLNFKKL
jgi:hypothetical protein